ncbi:MAG: hypothetical protein V3T86_12545 [Planctomycetota bacterium]
MSETSSAAPAPALAPGHDEPTSVVVRAYPKVVYLYLTWIASLVCGILQPADVASASDMTPLLGRVWLAIFVFNTLVIAFEFSRIRSVAISFFIIAFVFAGMQFGFLKDVGAFLGGLELRMNKGFYYSIAAVFSIIYLLVFINTRFSYWEIQPNEILHHHGFLGDVRRYPTRGLHMQKEISDVLEYFLLRAGTLVLQPEGEARPIVLENVISLNRVEDKIQRILGTLKVRMDHGPVGGTD